MFQSVTQDAANVYFTLADGTLITIAKGDNTNYLYTITYMPNGSTSEAIVDTVRYGCIYTLRKPTFVYLGAAFTSWNTLADGSGVKYQRDEQIVVMKNMTLYAQWTTATVGTENGHVWVDLDLLSGLKWATCNVGATTPEEFGNYYAWGETTPKYYYNWSTYKYGYELNMTKYCNDASCGKDGFTDAKTVLDPEDDAAAVNWGGAWRMPTDAEWTELRTNCIWTWTDDYNGTGEAGQIVTSRTNGNHIFLPLSGWIMENELSYGNCTGTYWSSSLDMHYADYAWNAFFSHPYNMNMDSNLRCCGRSVRPVCK